MPSYAGLCSEHPSVVDPNSEADFVMFEMFIDNVFANTVYQDRSINGIPKAIGLIKEHHDPVANYSSDLTTE